MTGDGKLPAGHDRTGHGRSMLLNLPGGPDRAEGTAGLDGIRPVEETPWVRGQGTKAQATNA
jgi:hypothetical protein